MFGSEILVLNTALSSNLLRSLIEVLTGEPAKESEGIKELVLNRERRRKLLKWVWIVSVVVTLIVSGAALGLSKWLAGTVKPGIVVVVFVWAALLGGTASVFLSPRMLTAIFGGLVGVSVNEASAGTSGLIAKANSSITNLAVEIGKVSLGSTGSSDFIAWMLWMFILVVGLFCLPAFFVE
jgi:hypothetical protein